MLEKLLLKWRNGCISIILMNYVNPLISVEWRKQFPLLKTIDDIDILSEDVRPHKDVISVSKSQYEECFPSI